MTDDERTVWVAPCPSWAPVPMLAFSPDLLLGVAPRGFRMPGVVWMTVTEDGVPTGPAEEPTPDVCPYTDLMLFRLAQAYSALMLAGDADSPPRWQA